MENEGRGAENRSRRRLARETWSALAILALGLTILGADKSPATRALQRFLSRGRTDAVTSAEIACGYRVTGTDADGPVEMPAGAVTNELLRRRGGFDWAFRVEPDSWRSSWKGGFLTGVTVLARGEVRPDIGTLYYPVPVTNGVSLLPEARWGMLSHAEAKCAVAKRREDSAIPNPKGAQASARRGEGSVFSHAVTTNGSLLLDWRNALVGRDPDTPTNLQMEIFSDGSFVWRTNGGSTSYLPVLPFDWDGDGLENSVDPEPLAPNPVDAHGTSAEWYRVVCSNVFAVADNSNNQTIDQSDNRTILLPTGESIQFLTNVNSRAYYFVDVVASAGPAPIRFNADRDSRLGSPAVVALAGETNRVPLLIGVEYSVTSSVPISVSAPDCPYVILIPDNDYAARVRWPLDFTFVEDADAPGAYTVEVVPYDPGVAFTWSYPASGGGASLLSVAHPSASSCSCWGGSGPSVVFDCSDHCDCGGGCQASGTGGLEDAAFAVTGGVCRCSRPDDPHDDPPPPPPDPLVGGLSVSFSKGAVIFEDEYRNTEDGPLVPRQSTTTRVTVSASGGPFGGSFTLTTRNLEKLIVANGPGPVALTPGMTLGPYETYSATFECAGVEASGSENDVEVEGTFTEAVTGWTESPRDTLTVVKVELEAEYMAPENASQSRHVYGVGERVKFKVSPKIANVMLKTTKQDSGDGNGVYELFNGNEEINATADRIYTCPISANYMPPIQVSMGAVEYHPVITLVEPQSVICRGADRDPSVVCLPWGQVGGQMMVTTNYVGPMHVSFKGIMVAEIPCDVSSLENYFLSADYTGLRTHSADAGAGVLCSIKEGNFWTRDRAGRLTAYADWWEGRMVWNVPIGWFRSRQSTGRPGQVQAPDFERNGDDTSRPLLIGGRSDAYQQIYTIDGNGTAKIQKHSHWLSRSIQCVIKLDGATIQTEHQ